VRVLRLIEYIGTAEDVAAQVARSVNGAYRPGTVRITAVTLPEGVTEFDALLNEAAETDWQPTWRTLPERVSVRKPNQGA
jgi:hypothetical protein